MFKTAESTPLKQKFAKIAGKAYSLRDAYLFPLYHISNII